MERISKVRTVVFVVAALIGAAEAVYACDIGTRWTRRGTPQVRSDGSIDLTMGLPYSQSAIDLPWAVATREYEEIRVSYGALFRNISDVDGGSDGIAFLVSNATSFVEGLAPGGGSKMGALGNPGVFFALGISEWTNSGYTQGFGWCLGLVRPRHCMAIKNVEPLFLSNMINVTIPFDQWATVQVVMRPVNRTVAVEYITTESTFRVDYTSATPFPSTIRMSLTSSSGSRGANHRVRDVTMTGTRSGSRITDNLCMTETSSVIIDFITAPSANNTAIAAEVADVLGIPIALVTVTPIGNGSVEVIIASGSKESTDKLALQLVNTVNSCV